MFGDYELSLHDYLSILRRRALVMILVFGTVLTASVFYTLRQPKIYESTATILVEGPQVQVAMGDRANQPRPEDRVNLIQQRLMTRESLIRIADRHNLFVSAGKSEVSETVIAEAMRGSIRLELMGTQSQWGVRPASISFKLSFQNDDPQKVLSVTQELADLFLSSNRQDRMDQASRTTGFLSTEADRVRRELESIEAKIAAFSSQQATAMPDNIALSAGGLQNMETSLRAAEMEQRTAQSELRSLEIDLAAARRGVTAPGLVADPGPSQTEQELERARTELAGLKAVYSESHPDVRSLVRRIQGLEQALAASTPVQSPSRAAAREQAGLVVSKLEAQVDAARNRVELLSAQQSTMRSNMGQLRAQVVRAPQIERQLSVLQREEAAAQARYNDLRSQLASAQAVENLEDNQQVERFTLLEPPLLPELPVSNRRKTAMLGFFLALVATAAVVVLLEMMFARVRGANALTALTGQRPMVIIPYIITSEDVRSNQLLRKRLIGIAVGLGLILLVVVHTLVAPLPELFGSLFSLGGLQ